MSTKCKRTRTLICVFLYVVGSVIGAMWKRCCPRLRAERMQGTLLRTTVPQMGGHDATISLFLTTSVTQVFPLGAAVSDGRNV